MKIYERTCEFGWEGDGGIGEALIAQIVRGTKTATCAPKVAYADGELAAVYASIGKPATVVDKAGRPWCNIRVLEVFETTFGNPDPRLVQGEGNGTDRRAFQREHRAAWNGLAAHGVALSEETVLIAELFEVLERP